MKSSWEVLTGQLICFKRVNMKTKNGYFTKNTHKKKPNTLTNKEGRMVMAKIPVLYEISVARDRTTIS